LITVTTHRSAPSTLPCVGILLKDDHLRLQLVQLLSEQGMTCWDDGDFSSFQQRLPFEQTDIVLVGIEDAQSKGLAMITSLGQSSSLGIIALPAKQSHETGKQCLQAGADHYLLRPLDTELLVIMIQALWRRLPKAESAAVAAVAAEQTQQWALDELNAQLIIDGRTAVNLSHQEFEFMAAVMQKPNSPINTTELHHHMFPDYETVSSHRLSVLLNRLRKKVKAKGHRLPIRSLYGRGLVYIQN